MSKKAKMMSEKKSIELSVDELMEEAKAYLERSDREDKAQGQLTTKPYKKLVYNRPYV